ncbi:tetratricopeptide repeat protein [bacterium]|nr:tetratricopeptide repeat protein [bacterium]NUN46291.1 tetratricopeptide repeat protein [bacterium]
MRYLFSFRNHWFRHIRRWVILSSVFCAGMVYNDGWTQQEGIEVLKTAIQGVAYDSGKVNLMHDLAFQYLEVDLDSAEYYIRKSEELSRVFKYKFGEVKAVNYLGYVFEQRGRVDDAKRLYGDALKMAMNNNDTVGLSRAYNSLAGIAMIGGKYREALGYYENMLGVYQGRADLQSQSVAYNNIGNVYVEMGDHEEALEYYFKSLKIAQEAGDQKSLGTSYINLGNVFLEQSKYVEALEYYQKSLEIQEKIGSQSGTALCFLNIGSVYEKQERLDSALHLYRKAYGLYKQLDNKSGVAWTLVSLGDVHNRKGNYAEAATYLRQSLEMAKFVKDLTAEGNAYVSLAQNYKKLRMYDMALQYAGMGHQIYLASGNRNRIRDVRLVFSEIYEAMGYLPQALTWYKGYIAIKDSLQSVEANRKTAELQLLYDSKRKDQQIALLQRDSTIKSLEISQSKIVRHSLIGGFLALIVVLVLLWQRYRVKRQSEELLNAKNAELTKINSDLEEALHNVKELRGMFPICANCKKVRDDHGFWSQIETYLQKHTDAEFTHSVCPECLNTLYPEFVKRAKEAE